MTFNPYHVPAGTDASLAGWLRYLEHHGWLDLAPQEQEALVDSDTHAASANDFWLAVTIVTETDLYNRSK